MITFCTSHRDGDVNYVDYEGTDLSRAMLVHWLNVDLYGNAETVKLDDVDTVIDVIRTDKE